jgi:pimeloyl-ACP methyl ester carboxylesterase
MLDGVTVRDVVANGVTLKVAEAGSGPAVLLCHGFPESWYSLRQQIPALAAAGYRVIAPDQRGYGGSDAPYPIDQYTIMQLVGDLVGLLDALGIEQTAIVGHDWGAIVAWNAALMRPDRFRVIANLSVPYTPRGAIRPTEGFARFAAGRFMYILYFQQPGRAEAELGRDTRRTLRSVLYSASASPAPAERYRGDVPATAGWLDAMIDPPSLPAWLSEADLDFYTNEFERSGWRGPLNWYRNFDRNWELLAPWAGAPVTIPALFIAGKQDGVIQMARGALDAHATTLPNLRGTVLIDNCGHWTQQEQPAEVNSALLGFLAQVYPARV